MDIQQIKYFLTLAEELRFWNTSEKVGITQSALSRQIMSSENELNLKLFDRDNSKNLKTDIFFRINIIFTSGLQKQ